MWGVVCCGCARMLAKDGTLLGEKADYNGLIDMQELAARMISQGENRYADFPTHEDADKFASVHGWSTKDPGGKSNHRCPECRLDKPKTKRSGAFVRVPGHLTVERTKVDSTEPPTEAKP